MRVCRDLLRRNDEFSVRASLRKMSHCIMALGCPSLVFSLARATISSSVNLSGMHNVGHAACFVDGAYADLGIEACFPMISHLGSLQHEAFGAQLVKTPIPSGHHVSQHGINWHELDRL
jgi:hypothetical protein